MIRLTHDQPLPEALRGSIVALGNFDGFHLGHQAVVNRAIALGFHERRPVIVATFDPHPVRFFKPDVPPFRLTSLDQRERLFAHAGADAMLVFRFDAELASMDADAFVAEILARRLGVAGVVTGDDFSFGKGRTGDVDLLRKLGEQHGVRAEAVVERGDGRGHALGFPTANVSLGRYQRPAYGIYAVRIRLDDNSEHSGVASFGVRPTFEEGEEYLETFIFAWEGDLYDRTIEIGLIAYLRPEAKFDSVEALVEQMRKDEAEARRLLAIAV